MASQRSEAGVHLTVKNHGTGEITQISARELLIAIRPTDRNMAPLDLRENERKTLSKFTYTREYTGILNNTAFVPGTRYFNMPAASAPDDYLILPEFSFTNTINSLGDDNLFAVIIVGDNELRTPDEAKALVQDDFSTMLETGTLEGESCEELEWVAFSTHGPMHSRVSAEEVKAGFFQELYQLQGERSTWWTGGAFSVNFQTTLWEFDETLFPKKLEKLN